MISCNDDIPLSVSLAVQCPPEVLRLVFVEQQAVQYNSVISESRLRLDIQNVAPLLKLVCMPPRAGALVLAPLSECRSSSSSWRERRVTAGPRCHSHLSSSCKDLSEISNW